MESNSGTELHDKPKQKQEWPLTFERLHGSQYGALIEEENSCDRKWLALTSLLELDLLQ